VPSPDLAPAAVPSEQAVPVPTEVVGYGSLGAGGCVIAPPVSPRVFLLSAKDRAEKGLEQTIGCVLPRAVAIEPMSGRVALACLGDDSVRVLSLDGGDLLSPANAFRVPRGPTGIAFDDMGELVVWSSFARKLTVTDQGVVRHVDEPSTDALATVERGRALFHETHNQKISMDGRACATCHPGGRDDGLVWAAPDGPRQTPMLVGRLDGTAPYGWNGSRDTITEHMKQTMKRLGGVGLDPDEADAVVAYLRSIPPPPRAKPHELTAVARGRDVFDQAGCASCHVPSAGFTDGYTHDLGATREGPSAKLEKIATFDTPSLRFVGNTAPYFHDGRYESLSALLADKKSPMGDVARLSPDDARALEAYLNTL
jgi:mono/diheme cytochrome c family protein